MADLDGTCDAARREFVAHARAGGSTFPPQDTPFGVPLPVMLRAIDRLGSGT